MKTKIISAILFLTFFVASYVNAAPKFEHFIFKYDYDQVFDIKLTNNTITWKSLIGKDKGQIETDYINRKKLVNKVEVIQWTERDGTFVTVVFDRAHLNVISSGKFMNNAWLWSGTAKVIQPK